MANAAKVAAVLVDDGEPTLAKSVESLRNQTVKCDIILAPGPKTDLELARSLVDVTMPPMIGIGRSRVSAILKADHRYILSCDSDVVYDQRYAEHALENLREVNAVRAATILPLDWSMLGLVETVFSLLPPYEFAYAFRKAAFLGAKIHKEDFSNTRGDIGWALSWRLRPRLEPRMVCWTRFPTFGAVNFTQNYLAPALAGFIPMLGVAGVVAANELTRKL